MAPTTSNANNKTTVGIDIGTESTKVTLGSNYSCEIVRTDAGMHTFPTAVSFQGKVRHMGETANTKGKNSVIHLNRLLQLPSPPQPVVGEGGCDISLEDFYPFEYSTNNDDDDDDNGELTVTVEYNGTATKFSAAAVLAMLLRTVSQSVQATMARLGATDVKQDDILYLISIVPNSSPFVQEQVLDAAYAAGFVHTKLVESPVAYAATYQRKFPEFNTGKTAMILDTGHALTSVSIVQFGEADEEEKQESTIPTFKVLSANTLHSFGAASVDLQLWKHFQTSMPKLDSVKAKSRAGQRLLAGANKMKHLLSQLPEGSVTVENVGENDTDVVLQATRSALADLCTEESKMLQDLIQKTVKEANLEKALDAVEIVGGGCRIPWVQAAIQQVVGADATLSRSLDDTSAALGAALVGELELSQETELTMSIADPNEAVLERRKKLVEDEQVMAVLDEDEKAKSNLRNQMEALVLELRSAKQGRHGALLPTDALDEYLNEMDDWCFSEEADDATRDVMVNKLTDFQTKSREMCAEYYSAVEKEHATKEQEMEEEAKKAQLENAAHGDGGDEEDHDNRRLPKKRRMEIVMKNKNEATELFKDGNWKFAAARYTKALTHCAKFVDLSPEDAQEVNDLKVTLNLNLALSYSKLGNLDQALRVCNEALSLSDSSAKAYYRRASIYYEKKRWDDAKQDIVKAKKLAEGDKAIQKLSERIDLQLKKQKEKEKKMASKMFG